MREPLGTPRNTMAVHGSDVLFVGCERGLDRIDLCGAERPFGKVICIAFSELSPAKVKDLDPPLIVSAMASHSFDMLDVMRVLEWAGYKGRYVIHCGDAPDTGLLSDELYAISTTVAFELVTNADLAATS